MFLGDILYPDVVKTTLEAENKYEAIDELVDLLVENHEIPLTLRDHVVDVVIEREKSLSTGMEYGIALPHGSTDAVDDIIGALGISRRGLPFDSLDGKSTHIVILLVLPKNKFQAHVRTFGGIAHLMSNASLRQALQNAPNSQTVIELIEKEEERLPLH